MQHYASESVIIYIMTHSPYFVCIYLVVEWACPSVRGWSREVGGWRKSRSWSRRSRHRRLMCKKEPELMGRGLGTL
jgi:hypothetical protein